MMKRKDDIDLNKIDIKKHTFILEAGTILKKVTLVEHNPLYPTGQETRNSKNPNSLTALQFQEQFLNGKGYIAGTGPIFSSVLLTTAEKEFGKHHNAEEVKHSVAYNMKILQDIPYIDTISICESERVDPTPDSDSKNEEFFHRFYGLPFSAQALKQKSAIDPEGVNFVFYPDNIPDFSKKVFAERIS
jgi:hypothetical protein